MDPFLVVGIVASLFAGAVYVERAAHPPRCRRCGCRSTVLTDEVTGSFPLVLEMAYRCPRCGRPMRRYSMSPFWE